ncbi:MAG: class I mannose-6-phosphate isomerase [Sarcina sp.]
MKYINRKSNYDKYPEIVVSESNRGAFLGYEEICNEIKSKLTGKKNIVAIDCYMAVYEEEILENILKYINFDKVFLTKEIFLDKKSLDKLFSNDLTEDRVFGRITNMELSDLIDESKKNQFIEEVKSIEEGLILVLGVGTNLMVSPDIHIYADLARWEIQSRYRSKKMGNYKAENFEEDILKKYKRGYFIEWRLVDSYKKKYFETMDYILDSNNMESIKMITGDNFRKAMNFIVTKPFRVVPFFDPGIWGGQWMKEVCNLDKNKENYAWCFDCVPEENSLLLRFGNVVIEIPSINLVLYNPEELLGDNVFNRFGAEFPIRFDFLDTMDGENLSLQVHPLKRYIKEKFNMDYTQEESYYILDSKENATVYLGLKENVKKDEFLTALKEGQNGKLLDVEKYINKFVAKKHDHFLIPSGTIHCSGSNTMVLEVSATPYIFTFKLWDWGRVGLDGLPRPIHIEHGQTVIDFTRDTNWVKENLVNNITTINEEEGCKEENTGLHSLEFIETRRYWFNKKISHDTRGNLNVLNLVEGKEAIVESPENKFQPFIVHYAETFIIPANLGQYTIAPYGESKDKNIGILKAYVREGDI